MRTFSKEILISSPKDCDLLTISHETEDARKAKFFEALVDYLNKSHSALGELEVEEIYEGMGAVSSLSENRIDFTFGGGRSLKDIPICPKISKLIRDSDCMYVVMFRQKEKWQLLDVISVCSVVFFDQAERIHITYNPLYANDLTPEFSAVLGQDMSNSLLKPWRRK